MCKKSDIIGVKKVSISTMSCLTSPNNNTDSEWWFFKKVRTAQNRLSEKFQALYASAMYKNEPLALSLEILH